MSLSSVMTANGCDLSRLMQYQSVRKVYAADILISSQNGCLLPEPDNCIQ